MSWIKDIIVSEKEEPSAEKRDLVDVATKIEAILDEIKKAFNSNSEPEKRELVDLPAKIEAIIDEIERVIKSDEKRGALVDAALKIQDLIGKIKDLFNVSDSGAEDVNVEERGVIVDAAQKVQDLIAKLKDLLAGGSDPETTEKRDLVSAATKIEAIIAEMKKLFHSGSRVQYSLCISSPTWETIFAGEEETETVEERDLSDVLDKVSKVYSVYKTVKTLYDVAMGVKDLVVKIQDYFKHDDSVDKRDLVDAAVKIEAILDEIKKFFKPEEKRGAIVDAAQKIQDLIAKIKDIFSSDDSAEEKRDLVDVATKVEDTAQKIKDLIARIKDILSSDTSDDSAEKRDLVDAAAKIEAILDEIKKFFKPEEKRGAIVHLAERWDRIIKKIKHIASQLWVI